MTIRTAQKISFGFVCLLIGIVLGAGGITTIQSLVKKAPPKDIRERGRENSLTSPLLECGELSQAVSDGVLSTLHTSVQNLVNARTKSGDILYASVYFRDLNNGPWFGINESDEFFPASLLKLPLAMSFYSKAEDDPSLLQKEIIYTPDSSATSQVQPFGPTANVEAGKKYTVKQLLDIMLQQSSNESAVALANLAGQDQIMSVYHDLGLKLPVFGKDYQIDTHKYASFFRILYNATYIDRASSEALLKSLTDASLSEALLKSLTDASFQDGLVAGIPRGIVVAHKFGSRKVDDSGLPAQADKVQLHDCGIVYAPGKPYLLCVMTQGTDFMKLATFIKDISTLVYSDVSKDSTKDPK